MPGFADILKILAPAGATVAGGLLAGRQSGTEKQAQQAQQNALNQLVQLTQQRESITQPGLQAAMRYYMTLLGVPAGQLGGGLGLNPQQSLGLLGGALPTRTGGTLQSALGRGSMGATLGGIAGAVLPSAVGMAGAGTLFGLAGGPIGAAIGAGVGAASSLIGRGRREADQLVPTQNALTAEIGRIQDAVNRQREAGTLTMEDLTGAADYISNLQNQFYDLTQQFGKAGPGARETIGKYFGQLPTDWRTEAEGLPGRTAGTDGTTALGSQKKAMMDMLAAPIQLTGSQYESARQNLLQSLGPGGGRDRALAQLEQAKAGDIGRMFTGVQPMAAEALSNIYLNQAPSSIGAMQALLYGTTGIANQSFMQRQQGWQTGVGIGQMLGQLLFGGARGDKAGA